MRRNFLILIFFLILIATASAPAGDWRARVHGNDSRTITNRLVELRLKNPGAVVAGPWLLAGDSQRTYSDTNGLAYFSNVLAGDYILTIHGSPLRNYPVSIFDTNGLVDFATVVGGTNTLQDFYTAAQVDAKIAAVPTGGGGVTNLVGASGLATVTTNGNNFTINVSTQAVQSIYSLLGEYLVRNGGTITADGGWVFGGPLFGDQLGSWAIDADGRIISPNFTGGAINLTNVGGLSSQATNTSGLFIATTPASDLWVSALTGDDDTGSRGNAAKPFLTIRAAEEVSQLGDTIYVLRGQYLETLLGAEGLVYELAADAVVGATNLPGPIFFASNVSFRLKGTGFVFSSTKAVETSGIGQIYMEGVTISPNSTTNNLSGTWFTP
jgi:hypothetical protein